MLNTREHILNVSLKLFLQKNFKEVTMKEIVGKTGISKGAFYHHFESKEQLFLEILNHALTSVTNVYKNLKKDSLFQFYHEYFNYYQKASSFFPADDDEEAVDGFDLNIYSLFFEGIKLFPSFQEKIHECLQIEQSTWEEVIHISRDKGEIKSLMSDEVIAQLFIFSSDGLGMQSIIMKDNSKEVRNRLIDLWDSFYKNLRS